MEKHVPWNFSTKLTEPTRQIKTAFPMNIHTARRVFTAYSVSRELAINVLILGQKSSKDSQIFQKLSPCPFHTKPHPLASMCRFSHLQMRKS